MKPPKIKNEKKIQALIIKLVELKAEAGNLCMCKTMHALEFVIKTVGWEFSDKLTSESENKK